VTPYLIYKAATNNHTWRLKKLAKVQYLLSTLYFIQLFSVRS
jgi:hypothetical protein